jgi:hypothetical protein
MEQATLFQLAKLELEADNIDLAERYFEESRQISVNLNDRVWVVHAEYGQALVAWARQDSSSALQYAQLATLHADELRIGLAREIRDWLFRVGLQDADEVNADEVNAAGETDEGAQA